MKFQFLKESSLIHILLFIISVIPLAIYPFILLANVMSLVGHRDGNESFLEILLPSSFLFFSTLYPFTFYFSWTNWRKKKIIIALLPIFHIIISLILLFLWDKFGS